MADLSGLNSLMDQLQNKIDLRRAEFYAQTRELEVESQKIVAAEVQAATVLEHIAAGESVNEFLNNYVSQLGNLGDTLDRLLGSIKATALEVDDRSNMDSALASPLETLRQGIEEYAVLLQNISIVGPLAEDFSQMQTIESQFDGFAAQLASLNIQFSAGSGEVAISSIDSAVDELTGSLDILSVIFSELGDSIVDVDSNVVADLRSRFDSLLQKLSNLGPAIIGGAYTDMQNYNPAGLSIEEGPLGSFNPVQFHSSLVDVFSGVVNFGDSVFDQNNTFRMSSGHVPSPLLGYIHGRFSNGKVGTEYLAQMLGLNNGLLNVAGSVSNYAYMGATSGNTNIIRGVYSEFGLGTSHGLQTQVSEYVANCGGQVDPRGLYVVSAGQVDLDEHMVEQYLADNSITPDTIDYTQTILSIQGNLNTAANALKAAGAKVVLVLGPGIMCDNNPAFARDFVYDPTGITVPKEFKVAQKAAVEALDDQLTLTFGPSLSDGTLYMKMSPTDLLMNNADLANIPYTYDSIVNGDLNTEGIEIPQNQFCFFYDDKGNPSTQGHMALGIVIGSYLEAQVSTIEESFVGVDFGFNVTTDADTVYHITSAGLCPRYSTDATPVSAKPILPLYKGRTYQFRDLGNTIEFTDASGGAVVAGPPDGGLLTFPVVDTTPLVLSYGSDVTGNQCFVADLPDRTP